MVTGKAMAGRSTLSQARACSQELNHRQFQQPSSANYIVIYSYRQSYGWAGGLLSVIGSQRSTETLVTVKRFGRGIGSMGRWAWSAGGAEGERTSSKRVASLVRVRLGAGPVCGGVG